MRVKQFIGVVILVLAGCAGSASDPGEEPKVPDIEFPDVGGTDAGDDTGLEPDVGDTDIEEDTGLEPELPEPGALELERSGIRRTVLLRGMILLPSGARPGDVLIKDGVIECVGECDASQWAAEATVVQTHGVISPGLIDSHNHLPYNFLPEWTAEGRIFDNRYQWADDDSYEAHILPYSANRSRGSHFCPGARWGEFRSLLHGTTTIQGQSLNQACIKGLVRNADHEHALQHKHMRTTISSPRDINDAQADNYMASFTQLVNPTTRLAVHMAEGLRGNNIDKEFSSFAGRDTRTNRHAGLSLLYNGTSILIHSLGLAEEEFLEVRDTDSKVVWSPSSNFALYGETLDIARVLELGITTGIGPDWTVSGEPDLLAELRFIRDYASQTGLTDVLTPKRVWEMVTVDGAEVVGLEEYVGVLEVGKRADISVFRSRFSDPYESVIRARSEDVELVLIDGDVYYGPSNLVAELGRNVHCEVFDRCGSQRFFCAVDQPGSGNVLDLRGTRQALYNIMEGIGYPEEEQYGRGDEVLELIQCE